MYRIGLRSVWIGASTLVTMNWSEVPKEMPELGEDLVVICGLVEPEDEILSVCENLDDIRSLFDSRNPSIKWYIGCLPFKLLLGEVFTNMPPEVNNSEMFSLVCECMSFNCGMNVLIPMSEAKLVTTSGLVVIVNGCKLGPEDTDVLVEKRDGYSLYREGN